MIISPQVLVVSPYAASIAVLILGVASFGPADADEPSVSPRIHFAERTVKLGIVPGNEVIAHRFDFRNVGSAPLTVDIPKLGCSCSAETHSGLAIPPGGEGSIFLEYSGETKKRERHEVSLYAVVRTNEPKDHLLTLKASVVPSDFVHPRKVDLGDVTFPYEKTARIRVYQQRKGNETLVRPEVRASSAFLVVQHLDRRRETHFDVHEFEVGIKPPLPAGRFLESLCFVMDGAVSRETSVAVHGDVPFPVEASPGVAWFRISDASPGERRVRLSTSSEGGEVPESVEASHEAIRASLSSGAKKGEWTILIQIDKASIGDKLRGNVRVHSAQGRLIALVPVMIYGAKAP